MGVTGAAWRAEAGRMKGWIKQCLLSCISFSSSGFCLAGDLLKIFNCPGVFSPGVWFEPAAWRCWEIPFVVQPGLLRKRARAASGRRWSWSSPTIWLFIWGLCLEPCLPESRAFAGGGRIHLLAPRNGNHVRAGSFHLGSWWLFLALSSHLGVILEAISQGQGLLHQILIVGVVVWGLCCPAIPRQAAPRHEGAKPQRCLSKEGESIHGWTQPDNTFPCCISKPWTSPSACHRGREAVASWKSPLLWGSSVSLRSHPCLKDHGAGDACRCSSVLPSHRWEQGLEEEECWYRFNLPFNCNCVWPAPPSLFRVLRFSRLDCFPCFSHWRQAGACVMPAMH